MSAKKRPGSQRNKSAARAPLRSEAWTSEEQAARKQIAITLRNCRQHYRKTMPNHWRFMVGSALLQMKQALMDCQSLDALRVQNGMIPIFCENFTVFDTLGSLAGIHCRAYAELVALAGCKRPSSKALAGDKSTFLWKFTLERFRETLRDGRSAEYALALHADNIGIITLAGQAGFFEELGDLLRKHRSTPFKRSLGDWIVRAWLPLCLWECASDGEEAHWRFCGAAYLLKLDYLNLRHPGFHHQFVTAWRNVRSKKMKLQAPPFVESDVQAD